MDASEPTLRLGGAARRRAAASARPASLAASAPRARATPRARSTLDVRTTDDRASPTQLGRCLAVAVVCLIGLVPTDSSAAPTPLRAAPGLRPLDVLTGIGGERLALLGPPPRTTPRRLPTTDDAAPPAEPDGSEDADAPAPQTMPSGTGTTGQPGSPSVPSPRLAPPTEPAPEVEEPDEEDSAAAVTAAAEAARSPTAALEIPLSEPAPPEPATETPKLVKGKSVPPFWIDRTYTTHRTRALTLPPLFFHRSGTAAHPEKLAHFDLSLTTGWYSQRVQKRRYFSPAILFFGSFSERTSAWGAVPLLMGYKRVGEQYTFGWFPLVWRWGNKSVKNLVVAPFHYHSKTPDSLRAISGLLFWYGHKNTTDKDPLNDLRYFIGAPIFYRVQKGPLRIDVGLPLYVGGRDESRGLRWHHVFPLVHWQSSEFGNKRDLWTPLFVQRSDKARSRKTWAIPPLLTFSRQTPTHRLFSATPLVWRSENRDKGSVAWSAFPWVSYRDPDQRNRVLFPLFWQFGDLKAGVTSSVLVPLAYARKTPDETRVYTLLGGGSRGKGGRWGLGITPLLTFVRRDPAGRSFQVVTPALVHVHDPKAYDGKGLRHVSLGVLGYYNRRGDRRDMGLAPLLFAGRDGTRSYQVITPLIWHRRNSDPADFYDTVAVGPAFVHRVKTGFHAGLPPVAVFGSDENFRYGIVPPLLFGHVHDVKAQRTLTISPLFARSKTPDSRAIGVLNLFWDVKRPNERHTALFPLFYRRQLGERALTLTPLGGAYNDGERRTWSAALLLYGYKSVKDDKSRGFGLIPLVFYDKRPVAGGTATNLVVGPLFARHRAPTEDLDMFTPLVWRTRFRGEKPRDNLAAIPFYFRQRQPGGVDVDAGLLPPFFYSRDPVRRTHTLVAGPVFHRLSRTSLNAGVAPIYWWTDSADKRRLISLPLIVHLANKSNGEHTTIAVPLWFDRRRANGRRTWVAFPFVVGVKGQFNFTRFSIAPPLFFDLFRLGKNMRFTGVLPVFFRYQKCGFREGDLPNCRWTMWGVPPLFVYGKGDNGARGHGALMLYYTQRDPGGRKFFTLLGGANVRPGERLTWYFLNVGHTTTRKFTTTVVFPLFFRKAHRLEDRSTTVALPPLFVAARREEYRWWEAGLLVWNFRRPHKVTTAVAPPIFYTSHSFAERRLTWLLPLFVRDNYWAKDRTITGVFPALFVQRRLGQDNDFVQFPLVWHIERGENQGTMAAFLWWDIRRNGKVTQVVPALFTRHKTRTRDLSVVGPGLGWWWRTEQPNTVGGVKQSLHWRALFGLLGGGNDGAQRYFSLFGGKIALRPKPVMQPRRRRGAAKAEAGAVKAEAGATP